MTVRVLIVDDDDHVRSVVGRLLERRGYVVHTAAGADSAYALLAEHTVDAVVMDLNMPGVPGEVLFFALVRRWPYLRERIAIMSGNVAGLDDELPLEIACCPRLAKPFSFEHLEAVIGAVAAEGARRQGNGG